MLRYAQTAALASHHVSAPGLSDGRPRRRLKHEAISACDLHDVVAHACRPRTRAARRELLLAGWGVAVPIGCWCPATSHSQRKVPHGQPRTARLDLHVAVRRCLHRGDQGCARPVAFEAAESSAATTTTSSRAATQTAARASGGIPQRTSCTPTSRPTPRGLGCPKKSRSPAATAKRSGSTP